EPSRGIPSCLTKALVLDAGVGPGNKRINGPWTSRKAPLRTDVRLRFPTLEAYDGSTDPAEHVTTFRAQMTLYDMFFWSLIERPPTTISKMLQCANQYTTAKALVVGKHEDHKSQEQSMGVEVLLPDRNHIAEEIESQTSNLRRDYYAILVLGPTSSRPSRGLLSWSP
ncbi:hypothetical protein BHE74_00037534, partial [Ensete ventricosum]